MKHALLFALGIVGLVATVFALRGGTPDAGKRIEYYASGRVQAECQVHDGVREGECRRYWPDGRPMAAGSYVNGLMSGDWTFWNEDGSEDRSRSGRYVAGEYAGG